MYTTFGEIKTDLKAGKTSVTHITHDYLNRIEEQKHLNAFVEVYKKNALDAAAVVDEKVKAGKAGKLAGMVIGVKDNICVKGNRVTAASKILDRFESLYNATVIERLIEEDAVIIGRLNCDEFAMGSSNERSVYGKTLNPHDNKTVPGGSSGASAAAVAAGLCTVALGSDTGGSIRQPASFCGVTGFKPTYGRVSRYGLIAYGSSFDQIGPFSNNIEDSALILEVIAGSDPNDTTCSRRKVDAYSKSSPGSDRKKIAVIQDALEHPGLDPEIKNQTEKFIARLKAQGHEVEYVKFDLLDKMVPAYHVLSNAEASSNLSRFDGMRYGYRSKEAENPDTTYIKSRSEGFGTEVKRRIMMGTFVLSAGYYDAYYSKAQKVRRLIKDKTDELFGKFDFLISPTTPSTAFQFGAKTDDPVKMYLEDIFTVHANLAGTPAVSLPAGKHSNGMPFGIQIMADRFEEKKLLDFSRSVEQVLV